MFQDKKRRLEDLSKKIEEGNVDSKMLPVIEGINSNPNYFTTSSCAGRIVLLQIPDIGDKENAEFLGKWHHEVSAEDIKGAFGKAGDDNNVFLLAQSPIIHVRCRDLDSATKLRNLALKAGLKYSTIKSLTLNSKSEPVKIVVEILSSENIHVPISQGKKLYPDEGYLTFLVESANSALLRAQEKIKKFTKMLS